MSRPLVAVLDYGIGNLRSAERALAHCGADARLTTDAELARRADAVVLPGVGAFGACMRALRAAGLEPVARDAAASGRPFLGICVGMQLLATRGVEHGITEGLGWIAGEVHPIERTDPAIKIPHMGWNDVALAPHARDNAVLEPGEAYFLHSYEFQPEDGHHVAAMTDHGGGIVAAVARDTIVGVQFHPEKSQSYGLEMLERFLQWRP